MDAARPSARRWVAVAVVLWGASLAVLPRRPVLLPSFQKPVFPEHAVLDMSLALSGVRRFGGDLAFIQMLQYYGGYGESPKPAAPTATPPVASSPAAHDHAHEQEGHAHEGHAHERGGHVPSEMNTEDYNRRRTEYKWLENHAYRILSIDPYFHYANLFVAGALGFNLNRNDEALRVLTRAAEMDPKHWRYRLYAGAIAYRKTQETEKVIHLLEEALKDPDCPSMLMNILGNIYLHEGNLKRAEEIFRYMLDNARDPSYTDTAREKLDRLAAGKWRPR
jgi:hypothetical protein